MALRTRKAILDLNMEREINNSNEVGVAVIFDKEVEGEEAKEGLKSKELTKSAGRCGKRTSLSIARRIESATDKESNVNVQPL